MDYVFNAVLFKISRRREGALSNMNLAVNPDIVWWLDHNLMAAFSLDSRCASSTMSKFLVRWVDDSVNFFVRNVTLEDFYLELVIDSGAFFAPTLPIKILIHYS